MAQRDDDNFRNFFGLLVWRLVNTWTLTYFPLALLSDLRQTMNRLTLGSRILYGLDRCGFQCLSWRSGDSSISGLYSTSSWCEVHMCISILPYNYKWITFCFIVTKPNSEFHVDAANQDIVWYVVKKAENHKIILFNIKYWMLWYSFFSSRFANLSKQAL